MPASKGWWWLTHHSQQTVISTSPGRIYGLAASEMDPGGRPCQSPVVTPQTHDQAGAVVTLATDATGALETVPECPAFPHLPADIQHALADFDARVADGRLPMAADGHPAIPAAAEAWISDFLDSHIPSEI